jgi:hypothetical protein
MVYIHWYVAVLGAVHGRVLITTRGRGGRIIGRGAMLKAKEGVQATEQRRHRNAISFGDLVCYLVNGPTALVQWQPFTFLRGRIYIYRAVFFCPDLRVMLLSPARE